MTALRTRPLGSTDPRAPARHIDWSIVLVCLALSVIGVAAIYSATQRSLTAAGDDPFFYGQRQITFLAVGLTAAVITWFVDHKVLRDWSAQLYAVTMLSLVAVLVLGREINGATSWFQLPGFQLQPSEFAKLSVIVALAAFVSASGPGAGLDRFVTGLAIAGAPMLLILAQPDVGTMLVFVAITMGIFLVGGARASHIVGATVVAIVGVTAVLTLGLLPEPQEARLTSFLNDDAPEEYRYNGEQSEIAIGAGGLTGRGWLEGTQTSGDFVPEQHTDFIFTAVAEEFGFVGAGTVLTLYAFLIWRLWRLAALARDGFGTLVILGVLSMFMFQIFQNVGMTVGVMPITGIPLPFLSHGGSSTIMAWTAIGLVLGVHARRFR
ncbi:MAG: rod shape-determining protein RodA [Actinomycetota bacterium]